MLHQGDMIVRSGGAVPIRDTRHNMPDSVNADRPETTGRSLVTVAGQDSARRPAAGVHRPLAAFLAQLVAAAQGAPQTRGRRRANLDHATARYAAATRRDPPSVIERSL